MSCKNVLLWGMGLDYSKNINRVLAMIRENNLNLNGVMTTDLARQTKNFVGGGYKN